MSLFSELKRWNALRAAAFCATSAWLLVQAATQLFPFLTSLKWVARWLVVGACIGFPFAMLFSWFYKWTPQGLQLESEIPPNELTQFFRRIKAAPAFTKLPSTKAMS
jgi:hypothetical protein